MADETNTPNNEPASQNNEPASPSRRTVVTTAAQVAVTAPAVAVLLNATSKSAFAQVSPYSANVLHILDDFTFGNNEEDVDAVAKQTNFSNWNHTANQDDVFPPIR